MWVCFWWKFKIFFLKRCLEFILQHWQKFLCFFLWLSKEGEGEDQGDGLVNSLPFPSLPPSGKEQQFWLEEMTHYFTLLMGAEDAEAKLLMGHWWGQGREQVWTEGPVQREWWESNVGFINGRGLLNWKPLNKLFQLPSCAHGTWEALRNKQNGKDL